jgi:hypothetical protein
MRCERRAGLFTMLNKLLTQRLLALFAVAALLFNFPLQQWWTGRPWAAFVLWGGVIACLAWLMERSAPAADVADDDASPPERGAQDSAGT